MSAELRQLRGRVSAQERVTTSLSASIEEAGDQLQEITATMATKQEIEAVKSEVQEVKGEIKQLSASVNQRFESVDRRFEHVYGELADIKANTVEIRNLVASLVARLEKGDGKG